MYRWQAAAHVWGGKKKKKKEPYLTKRNDRKGGNAHAIAPRLAQLGRMQVNIILRQACQPGISFIGH